jgi:PAS domain S-box-containing protein
MKDQTNKMYLRFMEMVSKDYIFYSHDLTGKMLYISPHVKDVIGISSEQIIGEKWQDVFNVTKQSLDAGTRADARSAEGDSPLPYEFEVRVSEETTLTFEMQERPFLDDNNQVVGIDGIAKNITKTKQAAREREELVIELQKTLAEMKTLRGLIPICSYCKNIRNDKGAWKKLEEYIAENSDAEFTHSICTDCLPKVTHEAND